MYPLIQSYVCSCEFYFFRRCWQAVKENLVYYGICLAVLVILIIMLFVFKGTGAIQLYENDFREIFFLVFSLKDSGWGVTKSAGLAWGLLVLFLLLGYGLVEVPKKLWSEGNRYVI